MIHSQQGDGEVGIRETDYIDLILDVIVIFVVLNFLKLSHSTFQLYHLYVCNFSKPTHYKISLHHRHTLGFILSQQLKRKVYIHLFRGPGSWEGTITKICLRAQATGMTHCKCKKALGRRQP